MMVSATVSLIGVTANVLGNACFIKGLLLSVACIICYRGPKMDAVCSECGIPKKIWPSFCRKNAVVQLTGVALFPMLNVATADFTR